MNPPNQHQIDSHTLKEISAEGLAARLADLRRAIENKDIPMAHRLVSQSINMLNQLIEQDKV